MIMSSFKKEEELMNFVKNNLFNCDIDKFYYRFLGLKEDDKLEIKNILKNIKHNDEHSKFPDYKFNNGFIELFQITSSKEERKGSKHTKLLMEFSEREKKEICEKINNGKHCILNNILTYPEHNYQNLVNSLRKNLNKHIESLENYDGNKNNGIFMIEYTDRALTMAENIQSNCNEGPKIILFYKLSKDNLLLREIYQYTNIIKYIIFVYGDNKKGRTSLDFEIIKTYQIPRIIEKNKNDYIVRSYIDSMLLSTTIV